jgi:hypothetical protein
MEFSIGTAKSFAILRYNKKFFLILSSIAALIKLYKQRFEAELDFEADLTA